MYNSEVTFLYSVLPLYNYIIPMCRFLIYWCQVLFVELYGQGTKTKSCDVFWEDYCMSVCGIFFLDFRLLEFHGIWPLPFSNFQARNSYSNEVVAIKKMSYNGKQTTEVRKTRTQEHIDNTPNFVFKNRGATVIAPPQFCGCVFEHISQNGSSSTGHLVRLWSDI